MNKLMHGETHIQFPPDNFSMTHQPCSTSFFGGADPATGHGHFVASQLDYCRNHKTEVIVSTKITSKG
jgi:hypothetical protein